MILIDPFTEPSPLLADSDYDGIADGDDPSPVADPDAEDVPLPAITPILLFFALIGIIAVRTKGPKRTDAKQTT